MGGSTASASDNHPREPLENILLGNGQWHPMPTDQTELSLQQPLYPPFFCTYAARFLIIYDANVKAWWTDVVTSTKEINDDQRTQQILSKNFGSFAKSLESAFCGIPSSNLYDNFIQAYNTNGNDEVLRQIAILFTLLPPDQQPTVQLDHWYKNQPKHSLSDNKIFHDGTNVWQQIEEISLLPEHFQIQKLRDGKDDEMEFVLQPSIPIYDQWVNDMVRESNGSMTSFGPMGSRSLVRDIPHYSWRTYALLGIAGATSCALTHAVVIPLDGIVQCYK
jgi:hypothetical protein